MLCEGTNGISAFRIIWLHESPFADHFDPHFHVVSPSNENKDPASKMKPQTHIEHKKLLKHHSFLAMAAKRAGDSGNQVHVGTSQLTH